MPKFLLKNCCYCVQLRLGCFIIGYMETILSGLSAMSLIYLVNEGMDMHTTKAAAGRNRMFLIVTILYILLDIASSAFGVILLIGLYKGKRDRVKMFLIYTVISVAICIITYAAELFFLRFFFNDFASVCMHLAVKIYVFLVVRSYYYQM